MDHYGKARREGLRVYSAAVQANKDPYLPVLEEKVPDLSSLSRKSLGVLTVPLDRVIGSVSQGRSYAFASNFFPILEGGSEFSGKWERLYKSVEDQGVNQPITALEYMGYYYVIEGNKRVSVMKSMQAPDIEADVTRVIPRRTDEPENIAYFEYCDFTKDTGLYSILFTKPGGYAKLLSLPGVRAGEVWEADEVLSLRKLYNYFTTAYTTVWRDQQPPMPSGDAFLSYLVAFGYQNVLNDDLDKTFDRVRLMAKEFESKDNAKLVMTPDDTPKAAPQVPLLSALFRPSKVKVAFLFSRSWDDSAWEYWHNMGRLELEAKLGDKVETVTRIVSSRNDFKQVVEPLIKDGVSAIFCTTPVMLNSCIEPALEHPETRFLCCSLLSSYTNIRAYYIRFYEAKFLMGLAAGILSENGKIGYIADYPIIGVPSAANAFALGARMVNPKAKIYMNWSTAGYFDPKNPFEDPEIKVICNRDINAPTHGARDYGLYVRENGDITNMATLLPQWGTFYRVMVERLLSGSLPSAETKNASTNYWWGMGSGMLDVAFSNRMDPYATRLISGYRDAIHAELFAPFEGMLIDQNGKIRCEADRRLTPAEILCMDYLLDNIIGDLPTLDQVIPSAQPLVKLQGIHESTMPQLSTFSWDKM